MTLPLLGLMNAAMYAPAADMLSIDTKNTVPAAPWSPEPLRNVMAMKPESNPTMAAQPHCCGEEYCGEYQSDPQTRSAQESFRSELRQGIEASVRLEGESLR